mmetsp:Transcript_16636/g.55431  ORF Transcript_16636/g.55431 Transcript_16636/m.55431 type:complete len:204 (-) Transcript_16636:334-945(-)
MLFDEITHRNTHLFLNRARIIYVASNVEQLGAFVPFAPKRSKPTTTPSHDCRNDSNGLNIGHGGGATPQANVCRKRRFEPWLALFAFQRFNHSSLFAANVCASTAMNIDIEVISTATSILAEFSFCIRLGNSFLQGNIFIVVFSTNVDVSSLGEHGSTNNQTSVHQLVRLMPENLSVLACAGFTLIGVHHKIRRSSIFLLGHE